MTDSSGQGINLRSYHGSRNSVVVVFLTWITLRFIDPIYRILGKTGSLVIARVVDLLI